MAENNQQVESVARFRRFALGVCAIGVLVQLGLTAYYLGLAHKAQPHRLPVGLVSTPAKRTATINLLSQSNYFKIIDYGTVDAMQIAIKHRDVYGGVDVTASRPHLYVASAAGPAAANVLRSTYLGVVQQQTAATLSAIGKAGKTMPVDRAKHLNAPPAITDLVPLPNDDVNGVSLGFLTQALALGGTIAAMGLGRLIPRAQRSWRRGLVHVSILTVYAVVSATVVLWSMTWFGVGTTADRGEMLGILSLISLALTASTAGAVALLGPIGALLGAMYFTLGTVISGASILPEFLPTFGRTVGENLPTGAGVEAVRDDLYFPSAEIGEHLTVLSLYAAIGVLVVLITNMLPNQKNGTSEVELALVERLEGSERREPVSV